MNVYVVYFNPSDYPERYVVRRWTIAGDGLKPEMEPLIVTPSLTKAREALPANLLHAPRQKKDDPAIVECWI